MGRGGEGAGALVWTAGPGHPRHLPGEESSLDRGSAPEQRAAAGLVSRNSPESGQRQGVASWGWAGIPGFPGHREPWRRSQWAEILGTVGPAVLRGRPSIERAGCGGPLGDPGAMKTRKEANTEEQLQELKTITGLQGEPAAGAPQRRVQDFGS